MDKTELEKCISAGNTQRVIAKKFAVSQSTVRFWLRKYGLKTRRGPHNKREPGSRKCKCGETDPKKFYGNKSNICSKCHNGYVSKVGSQKVSRIREILGGSCAVCGFSKYQCALDFHHLKPGEKIDSLRGMRGWSWEKILNEIKNGVLLCKNCHAAIHSGELDFDFGVKACR